MLQSRHGRKRPHLASAFALEQIGEQEREVDRLLGIEARVADRVIAVVEVLITDLAYTAGAFGDVLPGHFEVHTAGIDTLAGAHLEEAAHLLEDQVERPRLIARR